MKWRKDPRKKRGGSWRCTIKIVAAHRRYEQSTRSRIRVMVGGIVFRYRVPPEKKDELHDRLANFRADQQNEYHSFVDELNQEEVTGGGIDQAVS